MRPFSLVFAVALCCLGCRNFVHVSACRDVWIYEDGRIRGLRELYIQPWGLLGSESKGLLADEAPRWGDDGAARRVFKESPRHREITVLLNSAWYGTEGFMPDKHRWIIGSKPLIVGIGEAVRPSNWGAGLSVGFVTTEDVQLAARMEYGVTHVLVFEEKHMLPTLDRYPSTVKLYELSSPASLTNIIGQRRQPWSEEIPTTFQTMRAGLINN